MMQHDDAFELLALAALDALDDDEATSLDEHVVTCARCQRELDSMREVAAALGTTVETLPEGVWTTIADQLHTDRPEGDALAPGASVTSIAHPARRPARAPRRARQVVAAIVVGVAACVIALGIGLANANNHVARLEKALAGVNSSIVQSALEAPGHRIVHLETATHTSVATFVVLPDGRGYLVSASMPALGSGKTYQLWGIVNGSPVSIGVMGRAPSNVAFTLASEPRPTALAVTVQDAGGSLVPAKTITASGAV